MSDTLRLTCIICGSEYTKPSIFKDYLEQTNSVMYKWMMIYCDKCRRAKTVQALNHLPDILNAIATK
jgi:hypothetical protein